MTTLGLLVCAFASGWAAASGQTVTSALFGIAALASAFQEVRNAKHH